MFQGGAVDGVRVDATSRRLAPALTFSYTLYLARVGGDFMYARMLIPVTPLLLVLLEERLAVLCWPPGPRRAWGSRPLSSWPSAFSSTRRCRTCPSSSTASGAGCSAGIPRS